MPRRHVRLPEMSSAPVQLDRPEPAVPNRPTARSPPRRRWRAGSTVASSIRCSVFCLPGVGDLLGSALGLYPVLLAWQRRAPKALLARMLLNLAADAAGGAIPVIGDIWDFLFRAHARNLVAAARPRRRRRRARPLERHPRRGRRAAAVARLARDAGARRRGCGARSLTAGPARSAARKACPHPGPSRKREREKDRSPSSRSRVRVRRIAPPSGRGSVRRRWRPCSRCRRR